MAGSGAAPQHFSLKWNDYSSHIVSAFEDLRSDGDLTDVTLSCEGRRVKAHKVLLSACSLYFRDTFKENPCKHPVIIMKGVTFCDLEAVVKFMYNGQVNVTHDRLSSFLQTAELLQIKGLTDINNKSVATNKKTGAPAGVSNNHSTTSTAVARRTGSLPVAGSSKNFYQNVSENAGSNPMVSETNNFKRRKIQQQQSVSQPASDPTAPAPVIVSETQKVSLNSSQNLGLEQDPSSMDSEVDNLDLTPESSMFVPGTVLKFEDEGAEDEEFDKLGMMNEGLEEDDSSDIKISHVQSKSLAGGATLSENTSGSNQDGGNSDSQTQGYRKKCKGGRVYNDSEVGVTLSNKGGPKLVIEGYIHRRKHCQGASTYWTCVLEKCPGRAISRNGLHWISITHVCNGSSSVVANMRRLGHAISFQSGLTN